MSDETKPAEPARDYMAIDGKFLLAAVFAIGFVAAALLGREIPASLEVLGGGVIVGALGISATQWTPRR